MRAVPSAPADTARRPRGLTDTRRTGLSLGVPTTCSRSSVPGSQMRADPSSLAVTSAVPVGENAAVVSPSWWPDRIASRSPLSAW